MRISALRRRGSAVALAFAVVAATTTAFAATYNYVNWTAASASHGTASGTISLGDDAGVDVTFTATTADGGAGNFYGAEINGTGVNYWTPAATYESSQVQNAPPTPDIIQLSGGQNETYTVNLSQPVVDPIMAIVSLGGGTSATYDFNSPFTIVSQGTDMWGGSSTSLVELANNVLQGKEGSGVIQFIGTYSQFSWTVPTPETWHGFTFGILTSAALYDGGGPDGSAVVIVGPDGGADAGTVADASSESDASATDASLADSSTPDASVADGSTSDAGVTDSSALSDSAIAADAESTPAEDGGVEGAASDAESATDATVADASSEDATTSSGDATTSENGGNGPYQGPVSSGGGCSCKAAGGGGDWAGLWVSLAAVLGIAAAVGRRRTRRQ